MICVTSESRLKRVKLNSEINLFSKSRIFIFGVGATFCGL